MQQQNINIFKGVTTSMIKIYFFSIIILTSLKLKVSRITVAKRSDQQQQGETERSCIIFYIRNEKEKVNSIVSFEEKENSTLSE